MIHSTWKTKVEHVITVPTVFTLYMKSSNYITLIRWSSWIQLKGWHSFFYVILKWYNLPLKHVYFKVWCNMSLNSQLISFCLIRQINLFKILNGTEVLSAWKYRGRIRLYTYCIGHMTKTWGVSEKEGKESKSVANYPLDLVYGFT